MTFGLDPSIMALAVGALAGLGLSALSNHAHRRWFGFLPEDLPSGGRKTHEAPTPQVGFVLAAVAGLVLLPFNAAVATATLALGLLGYADDRRKADAGLSWRLKALVQLAAAALIVADALPTEELSRWLAAMAFVFCLCNAVNFLDNMNGVAASLGGLGVVAAGWPTSAWLFAGSLFIGFVPCNWPRARVFLGDGGALPLGALLAAAALHGAADRGGLSLAALLAPAAIPLLDFVQVITARLWLGYAPWIGDRRHLTHIANYAGVPKPAVAPMLLGAGTLLWLVLA